MSVLHQGTGMTGKHRPSYRGYQLQPQGQPLSAGGDFKGARVYVGGKRLFPASVPGTGRFWLGARAWYHWNSAFQEAVLIDNVERFPKPSLLLGTVFQPDPPTLYR